MDMEIGSMQAGWGASVQGYQKAEGSMEKHAKNIASITEQASAEAPPKPGSPDLANEMVGMKTSKLAGGYNLKALKVQNDMAGELMNLVG